MKGKGFCTALRDFVTELVPKDGDYDIVPGEVETGKEYPVGNFGGSVVGGTGTDGFAIRFGGTLATGGDEVAVIHPFRVGFFQEREQ